MYPGTLALILLYLAAFVFDAVVELLNTRHADPQLPAAFADTWDEDGYRRSQLYLADRTRLGLISGAFTTTLAVLFLLVDGFDRLDLLVRRVSEHEIIAGGLFIGGLAVLSTLASQPFMLYRVFGLEQRYGFNRMTWRMFMVDGVKGTLIGVILGAPMLAMVIWLFQTAGGWSWVLAWAAMTAVQLVLMVLAPTLIMPRFNTFTPLPEGDLRDAIEAYARAQNFPLAGVFTMDGSKRSSRSNAFFTGLGRFRRIVLFDTLVERHSTDELLGIVAHEMGHYKCGHIPKFIAVSIASNGLMFFVLGLLLNNPVMFRAFGMEHTSIYASLVFAAMLFSPLSSLFGIGVNVLSRRFEYQADAYAARTTSGPAPLMEALKRLSVDNLANLTPHPLKVFLEYSHPPMLERLAALQALAPTGSGHSHAAQADTLRGDAPEPSRP